MLQWLRKEHPETSLTAKLYFKIKTKHSLEYINILMTFTHCLKCVKKENDAIKHFRLNIMLRLVKLLCLLMKTNSPFDLFFFLNHYQKDQSCHAKAQADASKKKYTDLWLNAGKKGIKIIHWLCNQKCFFLMTCQSAARDTVEHLVLWQDAGEISPEGGGEKREGLAEWGGGWGG